MTIEPKFQGSEVSEQPEILPQPENKDFTLKDNLQVLLDSFSRVAAIADPVHRDYEITKAAKQLKVPLESYHRMFDTYRKPKKAPSKFDTVIKPVSIADKKVGDFIAWFQSISIFKLTAVFSQVTLLLAMISFFLDAPKRQQQAIDAARTVVESASSQRYSQARINALNTLNKYCVSLTGVNAINAYLEGIHLNNCYVQNKFSEMFVQWPPQFFKYQGFDLSYAKLQHNNLNGANLEGADLQGVNLEGAELIGANLEGANLEGANLEGAKLWRANLVGANLQNSNLQNSGIGRANLQGANFQGANLAGAKLYWSNIQGANFLSSNLQGANLSRSQLQGSDFYKANLKGASLRYTDLREGANLREAELEGANLEYAKFWSISQLKRGKNWEKAVKNRDWEVQITQSIKEIFHIGLIRSKVSFFDSYQKGMELAAVGEKVEIVTINSEPGLDQEPQAIQKFIDDGADAILLLSEESPKSLKMIEAAYESGVAIFNFAGCINEADANRYLFGCYSCDRYLMGYDSGNYLVKWAAKNLPGKEVNLALLDSTAYNAFYKNFKGFYDALKAANIPWNEVISTDVSKGLSISSLKEILTNNPQINIIWVGSNAIAPIAVQTVKELGLEGKVFVFAISNFTRDKADMLLQPNNPLESIIDQSGQEVGYQALKNAISVLDGNVTPYQFHLVKHRLFTKDDTETIRKLLNETAQNGESENN